MGHQRGETKLKRAEGLELVLHTGYQAAGGGTNPDQRGLERILAW